MARIRDTAVTISTATVTSLVCNMPTHATGDVILAFCSKSTNGTYNAVSGWTTVISGANSTVSYGAVFAKRAASAAETLTVTCGAVAAHTITVISVEGAFGSASNASDAFTGTANVAAADATVPYTAGSITPGANNSLVISFLSGGATYSIHPSAGWPIITTTDSGANSSAICYTQQKTAAAITGPTWTTGTATAASTITFMLAVRDVGTNTLCDAYLDRGTVPSYLLSRFFGSTAGDQNVTTYRTAAQSVLTSCLVNGSTSKTITPVSWGTAVTDAAFDPYGTVALQSGGSSTTAYSSSEIQSAWNLTQGKGLFFGAYRCAIPRDYVDAGTVATGGIGINFTNGTTANARSWVIGGQFDATTKQAEYNPFVIQVQQSSNTAYAWNSTVTWNNVTEVAFLSQGYYGACALHWHGFHMLNYAVLAGGTPSNPFGLDDITRVLVRGCGNIPVASQFGSAVTSMIPIQFGGGDPCAVSVDLASISFPTAKVTNSKYSNFHVDADYFGIEFYGKTSSDVFKFTNTVFNCNTSYYWKFNASHSANAVLDFSGSSVINASVTLVSTSALSGVSFISCGTIAHAGNTFTDCIFTKTRSTTGAYNIVSSGADNTAKIASINTALSKLTSCQFNNNTVSTNGALRIEYTGTGGTAGNSVVVSVDLSNVKFSGNTKDIYWVAPNYTRLVLNLTGGANPTTYVASAALNDANPVQFSQSNTFSVTNVVYNSEVRIFLWDNNPANRTELAGVENIGVSTPSNSSVTGPDANGRYTLTYTHAYSSQQVYVVVNCQSDLGSPAKTYQVLTQTYTLVNSTKELLVSQIVDRTYNNP